MRILLLAVLAFFCAVTGYAQQNDTSRIVSLSVQTMAQSLRSAPMERTPAAKTSPRIITLPMPDGSQRQFYAVANSILSTEFAKAAPELKTYSLRAVNDPLVFGRLTVSPHGVRATIFVGGKVIDISPLDEKKPVLHKSRLSTREGKGFECGTTGGLPEAIKKRGLRTATVSNGATLRTYTFAIVTTGEFYQLHSSSVSAAQAAVAAHINALEAIYERELAVNFLLLTPYIYQDPATDPWAPGGASRLELVAQALGTHFAANTYDIGHAFHGRGNEAEWGGGVAGIATLCNNGAITNFSPGLQKGKGWTCMPGYNPLDDISVLAHEVGHQFSMPHSWNGFCSNIATQGNQIGDAYEIGSGTTIMSYNGVCYQTNSNINNRAALPNQYFHNISLNRALDHMANVAGCGVSTASGNTSPVVAATACGSTFTLPKGTPFKLTGLGTDADGDQIYYTWEQFDEDGPGTTTQGKMGADAAADPLAPLFRSYPPSTDASRTFPNMSLVVANNYASNFEPLPTVARTLNLRLTGRDYRPGGGGIHYSDAVVNVSSAGPFTVSAHNGGGTLAAGSTTTVTWNLNGITFLNKVNIKLSVDGGLTYPYTLATGTSAADGTETVTIPAGVPTTERARIMVESADFTCFTFFDISDADFTVTSNCNSPATEISPAEAVTFSAGAAGLNLGLTNNIGTMVTSFAGSITTTDVSGNLVRFDNTPAVCQAYGNPVKLDTYTFTVDVSGAYTINHGGPFATVLNLYQAPFTGTNCTNHISSSASKPAGDQFTSVNNDLTANLTAGVSYVLVISSFSETQPAFPFDYTISFTSKPAGANVYNGAFLPPNYSYTYIAVGKENSQVQAVSASSDFTALGAGVYDIYGAAYYSGSGPNPTPANPANWVGQTTTAILSSGSCISFSTNMKPVTVTATGAPTLAISGTPAVSEGNRGFSTFSFTVERAGNTADATTVNWVVAGSSANAADFGGTFPSGTVSFAPGALSRTLEVSVSGDMDVEADESFTVTLSNPVNGTIATASANGTIVNDDAVTVVYPGLHFDGVNDYVTINNVSYPQNLTFETWLKVDSKTSAGRRVLATWRGTSDYADLYINTDGKIQYNEYNVTTGWNGYILGTVPDALWHHYTLVRNATNGLATIYIDGVQTGAVSVNKVLSVTTLRLGNNAGGGEHLAGTLGELRIWNIAKTATQIQADLRCADNGPANSLLLDIDFREGNPNANNNGRTTLYDQSGNNLTGTLSNFALIGSTSNFVDGRTLPLWYRDADGDGFGTASDTKNACPQPAGYVAVAGDCDDSNAAFNPQARELPDGLDNNCNGSVDENAGLHLDGVNDYITLNNQSYPQNLTAQMWLKLDSKTSASNRLILHGTGPTGHQMHLFAYSDGVLVYNEGANDGWHGLGMGTVPDAGWHHYALVRNPTTNKVTLYIDGVQTGSTNYNKVLDINTLTLGAAAGGSNNMAGTFDDLRIWNFAKTATQVQADASCTDNGPANSLLAFFDFNEGLPEANNTGRTTIYDFSGNNRNGILSNFALSGTTSNFVNSYPTADINLKGNGNTVSNGDTTPSVADNTDFGANCVGETITKTFTVENVGTKQLTVSSITIEGGTTNGFSTNFTAPVNIAAGSNASFTVSFQPTASGAFTDVVKLASNDCDETVYRFTVGGNTSCGQTAPDAPTFGPVTQPTCNTPTGSFSITNFNAAYTYTFTPAGPTVNGSGLVTAATGTYTVTATSNSLVSDASSSVTVNAQPATPVAPTTGAVTQPTCNVATGSFSITNFNAGYIYTFSPAGPVVNGSGVVTANAGSYTITATLGSCTSTASAAVTVASQPQTPATPTIGAITHPACGGGTGSFSVTNFNSAFTYTFSPTGPAISNAGAVTASAGTYSITVSNNSGCSSVLNNVTLTVSDNQPPSFGTSCPANMTVSTSNSNGAVVNYTTPVATDNCTGVTTQRIAGFASGSNFPVGTTTVTHRATDGAGNTTQCSFTVTVNLTNNPAVVTTTSGNTAYFEGSPVVVDGSVTVTDADNGNLVAATISITTGLQAAEDVLLFTNQNGITGTYNATTGVLSLSGTATVANYQTALRSVVYSNSSSTPATTNRVISFVVNDGTDNSAAATKTVTVTAVNSNDLITCQPAVQINNTPGQCTGTTTLVQPMVNNGVNKLGNVLNFDGVDDYVDAGNVAALNFGTGNFTIELWLKTATRPSVDSDIISKRDDCNQTDFWNVKMNNNGRVFLEMMEASGANTINFETLAPVDDNQWHHVAFTRSGTTLSVYIDGQLNNSLAMGGITNLTNAAPVQLGRGPCSPYPWGGYFNGSLDEVRVWTTARTAAEITGNKNLPLNAQAGLALVYHLDEGTGAGANAGVTVAADASGNGKNGTLTDFALTGVTSNWLSRVTITNNAPSVYPLGQTVVTWTANDGNGANQTCQQTVTVSDNEKPALTCPANISVAATSTSGTVVTYTAPVGTDNCTDVTTTRIAGLASGSTFPLGTTTVTYSSTDAAGNSQTCSFTVSVDLQVPVITSVSPESGPVGTTVTITGRNFNTTAADNYVFFGAVRATVTAASATSLTVTVPVGATYQPLSVLNGPSGLTGYAARPFVTTFTHAFGTGNLPANFYKSGVLFATETSPLAVALADMDGDGKSDLIVANYNHHTVSVHRNTSITGTITASSFATKVSFATATGPIALVIGDVDGDGKQDIAAACYGAATVTILRNTATAGSITTSSFAEKQEFTVGNTPRSIALGDLDGDGKPEIVTAGYATTIVSVLHNTSTIGSVTTSSFAPKQDFIAGNGPRSVAIGDLDGDGKPEIAVACANIDKLTVLRNTTSIGSITAASFSTKQEFATGDSPFAVAIADLDGDGKPDVAVANTGTDDVSVLRNTSAFDGNTPASFAAKQDFAVNNSPISIAIADLNGDGKPDMAVANSNSGNVSVLRNTAASGSITAASFASTVNFVTGSNPQCVVVADVDGDGKPEIAVSNSNARTVSVLATSADYYRSIVSGDWNNTATWESSPVADFSSGVSSPATDVPGTLSSGVTIRNGHTVTVTSPLTIDVTAVAPGGTLAVTGTTLTVQNNGLTLQSTAAGNGRIGTSTGTIAGNVVVERFISSLNNRAYRLLAPGVNTTSTIRTNWQEGGVNDNGYGTHITGSTTGANGFDATQTGAASLFTYNASTVAWVPAANTSTLTLNGRVGYLMYIRGNRAINLASGATPLPSSDVTLRATGTLLTGSQAFTGLAANTNGTVGFNLIANPYASAINWASVYGASFGVSQFYYYWDPNIGSRGGYVSIKNDGTKSTTTNASLHIQPGQSFFVQTLQGAGTRTLNIAETHKSATNNGDIFRVGSQKEEFGTTLYFTDEYNQRRIADGVMNVYNNNYSKDIDGDDAPQIANWDEDIAIVSGGTNLSIESRPLIDAADTIYLSLSRLKQRQYEWQFDAANFNAPNLQAVLVDNYSGTRTPVSLNGTSVVSFSVNSDAASAAADRFLVVFTANVVLPLEGVIVKASAKGGDIEVTWTSQAEEKTERYEVEKSIDGQQFLKGETVAARGVAGSYTWLDRNAVASENYYRIRSIGKRGETMYSKTVMVARNGSSLTVYPNPVTGNNVSLQLTNVRKGNYSLSLYNAKGQKLVQTTIRHAGGSTTLTVPFGRGLAAGVYQLQLSGNNLLVTEKLIKN